MTEFKKKLNRFFRDLRKEGFLAKQNWMCCLGCGFAALTEEELRDKKGVVFYHKQDSERLEDSKGVYLAFDVGPGASGLTQKNIGHIVYCTAKNLDGLIVEWNGNPDNRIRIAEGRSSAAWA